MTSRPQDPAAKPCGSCARLERRCSELETRLREAKSQLGEQARHLRRQEIELEDAVGHRSLFLANVSHELRTPLHAIIGYNSMLLDGLLGELEPGQLEKVGRVAKNAQDLLELIDDLLRMASADGGDAELEIARFDVGDLVDEVVSELAPTLEETEVDLVGRAEPALGGVESDRQKVKQILLGLVTNALDRTERGSVSLHAVEEPDEDMITIAVADSGVAIADEHLSAIFDAYARKDSSYARRRGTGLGLAISRRLAMLLGGDIDLETRFGRGATFRLRLPRRYRPLTEGKHA